MPITPADLALGVFSICNTLRVFAYLPQIMKIGRDTQGAVAISYTTWALFGVSHLSTVAYAVVVVDDWRMAVIFGANTLCCLAILGLTAWKRALFRTTRKAVAAAELSGEHTGFSAATGQSGEALIHGSSSHPYGVRVVSGAYRHRMIV
jgi:uncharacterized protein with PQ loop repeat